jgi:hypothetical protein
MFRWRGVNRQPEPGPTDVEGKANIGDVGYDEQGCKGVQSRGQGIRGRPLYIRTLISKLGITLSIFGTIRSFSNVV